MEETITSVANCAFIFPTRRKRPDPRTRTLTNVTPTNTTPPLKPALPPNNIPSLSIPRLSLSSITPQFSAQASTEHYDLTDTNSKDSGLMPTSSSSDTFGALDVSDSMKTVTTDQEGGKLANKTLAVGFPTAAQTNLSLSPSTIGDILNESVVGNVQNITDSTNVSTYLQVSQSSIVSTHLLPAFEDGLSVPQSSRTSCFSVSAYNRDDNSHTPVRQSEYSHSHYPPSVVSSEKLSESQNLDRGFFPTESKAAIPHSVAASHKENDYSSPVSNNQSYNIKSPSNFPPKPFNKQRKQRRLLRPVQMPSTIGSPYSAVVEYVKGLRVELWIDQEEHRTIRPQFVFKRHTPLQGARPGTSSLRPTTGQSAFSTTGAPDAKTKFWEGITESGLVDLRLAEREVGTFHCGKLSREAVIRRLVVNGDDEKDFLSNNITLPLKENGVYAVYGTEQDRTHKSKKMVWKFEYTIEEKRVSRPTHTLSGEKLLRPLSFICSPELLAPPQAMTVTLIHIFSKMLAHSPTAKRVPPPTMPPVPVSATSSEFSYTSDSSCPSPGTSKNRVVGTLKSFSRPTTPQKDVRLFAEGDNNTTGRQSFSSGRTSSSMMTNKSIPTGRRSKSADVEKRILRDANMSLSSIGTMPATNDISGARTRKGHEHTLSKLELLSPHRNEESPPRRPHTTGSSFEQSIKRKGGSTFIRRKALFRPATALPSPSLLFRPNHLGFTGHHPRLLQDTATSGLQVSSINVDHSGGHKTSDRVDWCMPSEEDVGQMLGYIMTLVRKEQGLQELAARSNCSKERIVIEGLDSETDIRITDESWMPVSHNSPLPGRRIMSMKVLDTHDTSLPPSNSSRRPSTAQGSSAGHIFHGLSGRSTSLSTNRPSTSQGTGVGTVPSTSNSPNPSSTNLGLPLPPRWLRGPIAKEVKQQ